MSLLNQPGNTKRVWNAAGGSMLNNTPGSRRVWNADGTTTTSSLPAPNTPECTICKRKRIACVAAGVLIGAVLTMLFASKSAA